MAIRLKKAAQKIALGQKLVSKPAGNLSFSLRCHLILTHAHSHPHAWLSWNGLKFQGLYGACT